MNDAESHDRQDGRGPRCEHEDRLVGLLVDGDADGAAADSFMLLDHLAGCARCAGAVAAARRIDALVAETTVRPAPAAVEGWLAAAVREPVAPKSGVRAEPAHPIVEPVSGGAGRVIEFGAVLAAALCVAAVSVWLVLRAEDRARSRVPGPDARIASIGASPVPEPEPLRNRPAVAAVEGVADPSAAEVADPAEGGAVTARDLIVLSDLDPELLHRRLATRSASDRVAREQQVTAAALLEVARWPEADPFAAASTALLLAWRPPLVAALHGWRQDAAVAAYERAELSTRILWLGGEAGDRIAQWVDASARGDRALRTRLAQLLRGEPSRSEVAAAAWLGGAEFESALQHVAARNYGARWHAVVAATRRAADRGERGRMLLDLVLQAQGRDGSGDPARSEAALVQQVFAGLGGQVALELARMLPSLRRADERRVALRALGEFADPATSTVLSSVLLGPRVEEAELAAWALGRIAAGTDGLADLRPPRRRMDLWRAALVSRRDPLTRAWIDAMDLTGPERELLLAGDFTPTQCGVVARLLGGLDARR